MSNNVRGNIHSFFTQNSADKDQASSKDSSIDNIKQPVQVHVDDIDPNYERRKRQRTISPERATVEDAVPRPSPASYAITEDPSTAPDIAPIFDGKLAVKTTTNAKPSPRRGQPRNSAQKESASLDWKSNVAVVIPLDFRSQGDLQKGSNGAMARTEEPEDIARPATSSIPQPQVKQQVLCFDGKDGTMRPLAIQPEDAQDATPPGKRGRTKKAPQSRSKTRNSGKSTTGPFATQATTSTDTHEPQADGSNIGSSDGSLPVNKIEDPETDTSTQPQPVKHTEPARTASSKKVLHFNIAHGTIGSPPKKKDQSVGKDGPPKPKRGRKPKALLVKLSYGQDESSKARIGQEIDRILMSPPVTVPIAAVVYPIEIASKIAAKKPDRPVGPPKPPHPFFLGRAKLLPDKVEEAQGKHEPIRPTKTFITPRARPIGLMQADPVSEQTSDWSTFTTMKRSNKFPDSVHPLWPPLDMMHVRNLNPAVLANIIPHTVPARKERKSKYVAPEQAITEDMLGSYASRLDIASLVEDMAAINTDDFDKPHHGIRLPKKCLMNGTKLQREVAQQLSSSPASRVQVGGDSRPDQAGLHPAVLNLYNALATTLSSFDESKSSVKPWSQRFAPVNASTVLSAEHKNKDAYLLREWLKRLTVVSVDAGSVPSSQRDVVHKRRKRKRRALDDPDGFIVHSDESDDCMEDITDVEEALYPGSQDSRPSTVRYSTDEATTKSANALVISGPSGCGKTAMVYAVAKELGFEVFEINPGSRRSGKDILDRVGDMTKNHLVQNSSTNNSASSEDEDAVRHAKVLAAELESGRQNTMNSFFKPKPKSKSDSVARQKAPKSQPKINKSDNQGTAVIKRKPVPKEQKQSLILLEEADLLYKDDKDFWVTVLGLIAQSKRPVIITCNDESAIPLTSLTLGAVLRPRAPPVDLAVDYALLIAAHEGHVLRRESVESLYRSRNNDLRGLLTELQFWCQMTVGDRKSGMDWFVPRWPKGCDLDENGQVIRAISVDTYHTGMGRLHNHSIVKNDYAGVITCVTQDLWDGFRVHPIELFSQVDRFNCESNTGEDRPPYLENLEMLWNYEKAADGFSMVDLCFGGQLATENSAIMDTTTPHLSEKIRNDYTLGSWGTTLLQTDIRQQYDPISEDIAIHIMSKCQALMPSCNNAGPPSSKVLYSTALDIVEHKINSAPSLSRRDLSTAFDPIAAESHNTTAALSKFLLDHTVFDRPVSTITLDIAPYIRSIVAYDTKLAQERVRLSSLLSQAEGSSKPRKMRKTRSAYSALEGGQRSMTRQEAYFGEGVLDEGSVMRTAPKTLRRQEDVVTSVENVTGENDVDELA